jgi:hypothetical protein
MVSMDPKLSKEEIVAQLVQQAVAVWGPERAEALKASLEETGANLWLLNQNLPRQEEEPAFFFKD